MKITIKNLQKKIPISAQRIKKVIRKVLSFEGKKLSGEITICFINDKKIKGLNARYLGKNTPTDVLVFNLAQDKQRTLADIAISTDSAGRNARIFHTSILSELYLYVIHGVLHLLGYHDSSTKEKLAMQKKERGILAACPSIKPKPLS